MKFINKLINKYKNNNKKTQDPRIKRKRHTWIGYAATYLILLILSSGQAMILAVYMGWGQDGQAMPFDFIFGMMGYWAIVTAIFIIITARQKVIEYDRPLQALSAAAKNVASGDFTVKLIPKHTFEKYDYIDVLFEDFNKMVEELSTIETLKSDFISNVSHEIKTPLAVIQNYATILQNPALNAEERSDYTTTIISATVKLNALVANILKLSKLENQKIVPNLEEFDLCTQLTECALLFEDLWENKNIDFVAEMQDDKCIICADKSMLEIVWQNLLSNALKFTEINGKIILKQFSDENSVTVSVQDNGCGMNEATMRRIFDKFYQGDTSHSGEGNGLGLALALKVVELLDGEITVRSDIGEGSEFIVRLHI